MLVEAGQRAGASRVELVYESECATAFFANQVNSTIGSWLKTGDVIVTADLGGGTADFAAFEITDEPEMGAKTRLRQVRSAEGTTYPKIPSVA